MSNSLRFYGLYPTRLLCTWGVSRQEYWSVLPCPPPGDLPNPGIESRHCRQILYSLSHQGSPWILEWVAYIFSRGIFPTQEVNWCFLHQARILEWIALSSSRASSQTGEQTRVCLHLLHCRQILYPLSHLGNPQDTVWSSNSSPGTIPQIIESKVLKRYLYTPVHRIIIHNSSKSEATQVFISGWIGIPNALYIHKNIHICIYMMEYYLALKRKEILTHATTWMKLEDIMLSKKRPLQEDQYCMASLVRGTCCCCC